MGAEAGDRPKPHGSGRHVDFILLVSLVATSASIAEALAHAGWLGGTIVTALLTLTWLIYAYAIGNRFLVALWIFGIAAGMTELWADCDVVERGILVYAGGGPFIACSPLYMPFGWATELAELGFLAHFLLWHLHWPMKRSILVTALVSASQMPLSEYLARSAGLWHYQHVSMLFGAVPYFIIASEFLAALPLAPIAAFLHRVKEPARPISMWWAVAVGLLLGVWIRIAAAISLWLFP